MKNRPLATVAGFGNDVGHLIGFSPDCTARPRKALKQHVGRFGMQRLPCWLPHIQAQGISFLGNQKHCGAFEFSFLTTGTSFTINSASCRCNVEAAARLCVRRAGRSASFAGDARCFGTRMVCSPPVLYFIGMTNRPRVSTLPTSS